MSLAELAAKYGTDKLGYHSYIPVYEELLAGRTIRKMLEIGIGYPETMSHMPGYKVGASLWMWHDYFHEAEIYGLDIRLDVLINKGRIKSFYCDQSSEASLKFAAHSIGGDIDFIVDDGSHIPTHQVVTAKIFHPLLSQAGIYVIEDVREPEIIARLLPFQSQVRRLHGAPDDDNLIIG